jgi:hypothetical protein
MLGTIPSVFMAVSLYSMHRCHLHLIGLGATVGIFLSIATLSLSGCCANEMLYEHVSPDGKWKYITFDRNCGATTGDNF